MLKRSRITRKGQATIPAEVRAFLDLEAGDMVSFAIDGEKVIVQKSSPLDEAYLRSLEGTLADEWLSTEDSSAYDDL